MINKTIHYCWFGKNKKPEIVKRCINSWKKKLPDYEIKEWNESNFDIGYNKYTRQAYEAKKYAFVSDVARLKIIYEQGGIYLDTDVEIIKSLNPLLKNKAFFGIESNERVNTGICFGAEARNEIVKKMLDDYNNIEFCKNNSYDLTPCPIRNSKILTEKGFKLNNTIEKIDDVTVYPSDYFNPKMSYGHAIALTENTYSIHHYAGSWLSKQQRQRSCILNILKNALGDKAGAIVYKTIFSPYVIISKIIEKVEK